MKLYTLQNLYSQKSCRKRTLHKQYTRKGNLKNIKQDVARTEHISQKTREVSVWTEW